MIMEARTRRKKDTNGKRLVSRDTEVLSVAVFERDDAEVFVPYLVGDVSGCEYPAVQVWCQHGHYSCEAFESFFSQDKLTCAWCDETRLLVNLPFLDRFGGLHGLVKPVLNSRATRYKVPNFRAMRVG
jgi:hypothetical protein